MNKLQKSLELIALFSIIVSIILKCTLDAPSESGLIIAISFFALLIWLIFLVCTIFPADWRMTQNQKERISNMQEYQNKYKTILATVNLIFSILMTVVIIVL